MMHISRASAKAMVEICIGIMVIQLFVIGYVFITAYQGRVDIVEAQREGCERGKLDRDANALGWRQAEEARMAEGQYAVAKTYRDIANSLESRSEIECTEAFPDAEVIP